MTPRAGRGRARGIKRALLKNWVLREKTGIHRAVEISRTIPTCLYR